ncbi:hypothetical protein B0H16DRAFT_1462411 [Mycena metata]|uniref:Uncharacterized protein n=1 Tax=Mycena metata TaxID=1033252 RepID=A0AAD7N5P8_9AGAR|nr:hypothetical protein B0H16DRAFT_1462411 [Mycena metata]
MSSRVDPFLATVLAQQSIPTLPNPYVYDEPGVVYVVRHVCKCIYDLQRAGQISCSTYFCQMQIKVGHTNRFSWCRSQYKKCNSSHVILWSCHFSTYQCMLLICLQSYARIAAAVSTIANLSTTTLQAGYLVT